jgi:myo-inositol-1(or 4)-monophosphatase
VPATLPELLVLARSVATEAGAFLLDGLRRPRTSVVSKSSATDLVSEMDRGAEDLIVTAIRAARPDDGFLGEEGTDEAGTTGVRWIIDPLDGTTNYLYGHPQWSVSVGVEVDGVWSVGVVDAPMLRETFTGAIGHGVFCNDVPIAVTACTELSQALVATGYSYVAEQRERQGHIAHVLLPQIRDLRRGGSAALDFCFVAAGRLDAYYEAGCHPWDVCAGSVIVREAGGVASGLDEPNPTPRMNMASTVAIHEPLQEKLRALI